MHGEYLIEITMYLQSVRQVGLTVTFSQTHYRVLWAVKSSNFSPFSTSPVSVTAEQGPIQPDQGFRAILSYPLIGLETEGGLWEQRRAFRIELGGTVWHGGVLLAFATLEK